MRGGVGSEASSAGAWACSAVGVAPAGAGAGGWAAGGAAAGGGAGAGGAAGGGGALLPAPAPVVSPIRAANASNPAYIQRETVIVQPSYQMALEPPGRYARLYGKQLPTDARQNEAMNTMKRAVLVLLLVAGVLALTVTPGYVERQPTPPPAPPAPTAYWYYCSSAKQYYPTVPSCPEEWVKVPERPR